MDSLQAFRFPTISLQGNTLPALRLSLFLVWIRMVKQSSILVVFSSRLGVPKLAISIRNIPSISLVNIGKVTKVLRWTKLTCSILTSSLAVLLLSSLREEVPRTIHRPQAVYLTLPRTRHRYRHPENLHQHQPPSPNQCRLANLPYRYRLIPQAMSMQIRHQLPFPPLASVQRLGVPLRHKPTVIITVDSSATSCEEERKFRWVTFSAYHPHIRMNVV